MAAFAVVSALVGFLFLATGFGRVAGYSWLVLFTSNEYLLTALRRAMSESTLLLTVFFTLSATAYACSRLTQVRRASGDQGAYVPGVYLFAVCTGLFAGLSGAAKLNGLLSAGAAAAVFALAALSPCRRLPRPARVSMAIRMSIIVILVAGFTFVAINPFLWVDATTRVPLMLRFRLTEMQGQMSYNPEAVLIGLWSQLSTFAGHVFADYTPLRFAGSPVANAALCLVGVAGATRGLKAWWLGDTQGRFCAVLVAFSAALATPSLFSPLDWDRYYLLPVVFTTLFICVGISLVLRSLVSAGRVVAGMAAVLAAGAVLPIVRLGAAVKHD